MKAFDLYSRDEMNLRLLINKLQNYGKCNCSFETFQKIYALWHNAVFPGVPVDTASANFRDDWFNSFLNYIANCEIEMQPDMSSKPAIK